MKPTGQTLIRKTIASGLIAMACFALTPRTMAQSLSTEGIVKLANSNMEYFSQGKGDSIVLLPGGTLTVGYLDAMATALAAQGYAVDFHAARGAHDWQTWRRALEAHLPPLLRRAWR